METIIYYVYPSNNVFSTFSVFKNKVKMIYEQYLFIYLDELSPLTINYYTSDFTVL